MLASFDYEPMFGEPDGYPSRLVKVTQLHQSVVAPLMQVVILVQQILVGRNLWLLILLRRCSLMVTGGIPFNSMTSSTSESSWCHCYLIKYS